MFQFPGSPSSHTMYSCAGYLSITLSGFPHSDILGSMFACNSPRLFAACHVLHRLLVPRHPPYALYNLTIYQLVFTPLMDFTFVTFRCVTLTYTVFKVQYSHSLIKKRLLATAICFAKSYRHSFLVEK